MIYRLTYDRAKSILDMSTFSSSKKLRQKNLSEVKRVIVFLQYPMRVLIFIFTLLISSVGFTQDSTAVLKPVDSTQILIHTDSVKLMAVPIIPKVAMDSCRNEILRHRVHLNLFGKAVFLIEKEKDRTSKEWLFYYILGLSLLFGLLRLTYLRYFKDLFRVFFRTSLRVNQIREQLVQSGLQSLLFNIFFAITAGTYMYLLAARFKVSIQLPELFIPLMFALVLAVLYLGKYIFLRFSGWLFSVGNATEAYSFIVFLINKIIGVILLPFIILIAFARPDLSDAAITASLAMITGLFLYRFLRAYNPINADLKVGRFHFFIFFLAFEIAPLLVIGKVVIRFL